MVKTLSTIIPYKEIRRTDRIIEDKKNNLWFATAFKGIGRYDGKTYTQNIFKAPNPEWFIQYFRRCQRKYMV
jgi:hypothetical protein